MKNYNLSPKNEVFDLFKLDAKVAKSPNSWLWCTFKSDGLRDEYLKRLEITKQSDISAAMYKKLACGKSTLEKHLIALKNSDKSCCLPIKVVDELCNYLNSDLKIQIKNDIIALFFQNRLTKPVVAVKTISVELAEFIGAFAADGYFCGSSNDYYIKITEGYEASIKCLQDKIYGLFSFNGRITYSEKEHCWNLWIKNRVITRYFEMIFGFSPGRKAATVSMPDIIKRSPFLIRKAFVRGAFTFDGCVKTTGNIAFTTMSSQLMQDIIKVLKKDKISFKITYNKSKYAMCLESSSGRDKRLLKRWKDYFLEGTSKHKKTLFFLGELKIVDFNALEKLFPLHHHNRVRFREIYNAIKHLKKAEINEIIEELKIKKINVAATTLYKYIYILSMANLIGKEIKTIKTNKNGYQVVAYYAKEQI
ncbi:hypothetical protein HYU06_06040 [Candidatus Woesearchaeota archaeon]|nr:hypothetical protein [Candidatus Woesearchaeota archaeon]